MTNVQLKREAIGISQAELAKLTGLSAQYICDIEKGRSKPSFNAACKIASAIYNRKVTLSDVKELME